MSSRPGDWKCPKCGGMVFASKSVCRCGGKQQQDWTCVCGGINFEFRSQCYKCNKDKLVVAKSGDWICSKCNKLNFKSRETCFGCQNQKVAAIEKKRDSNKDASTATDKGDWTCPKCNDVNFGSRVKCRKCGFDRPSAVNTSQSVEKKNEDDGLCVVCLDVKATLCITVCGHMALCASCSPGVTQCPMCRKTFKADQLIKVFSS